MRRIDTPTARNGMFSDGSASAGINATALSADWFNDVQEELISILSDRGIAPGPARNQVLTAIKSIANEASGRDTLRFGAISGATARSSSIPRYLDISGRIDNTLLIGASSLTPVILQSGRALSTLAVTTEVTGLSVASSSGNTTTVNDDSLTDTATAGFNVGEPDFAHGGERGVLTIADAASVTAIAGRIGQRAVFSVTDSNNNTEYFEAYIESATRLTNLSRGTFVDSSGSQIKRVRIVNGQTITLVGTNRIYRDFADGTFVVYGKEPVFSAIEPVSPDAGDVWFDHRANTFKVHENGAFVEKTIAFLNAVIACDDTKPIAIKYELWERDYSNHNTFEIKRVSDTLVRTVNASAEIDLFGELVKVDGRLTANLASQFAGGESAQNSTKTYLYITETKQFLFSNERPVYDWKCGHRRHPVAMWRPVSDHYVNASGELVDNFSYFPYHRYNINAQIPTTFSFIVDTAGDVKSVDAYNPVASATYADDKIMATLRADLFTVAPMVTATPSTVTRGAAVAGHASEALLEVAGFWTMSHNAAQFTANCTLTLMGAQALQAQTDNELKG